jgi:hypothetical protein
MSKDLAEFVGGLLKVLGVPVLISLIIHLIVLSQIPVPH